MTILARLAHQVLVGIVEQVVHGPPVPEMDVVDDAELLEGVERPVDRRAMDVGV